MRFASIETDFWQLESGVERQRTYAGQFWLPTAAEAQNLEPGHVAQLLFEMEGENEDGSLESLVQRMWVLVVEVHPDYYLGRLTNQPAYVEPDDDFYLHIGAEVPFRAEHVIDIHQWNPDDVDDFMRSVEVRRWFHDQDPD